MSESMIAKRYDALCQDRRDSLDAARMSASLTKPWVLPPENHTLGDKLPEPFTMVGSKGLLTMTGKMLASLFPASEPFFRFDLAPEFYFDDAIDPERKHAATQALMLREMQAMATLESASVKDSRNVARPITFRSEKRQTIDQLLITGDSLEYMDDNFRLRLFPRHAYCTRRDGYGSAVEHVIHEQVDVRTLSEEVFAKSDLDPGLRLESDSGRRMQSVYTHVEWNPESGKWVIRQEINKRITDENEERVTPYFSTAFEIAPGEHYGRGFVELVLGSLRTANTLTERMLEWAALAAKQHIATDYSYAGPPDIARLKSGEPIQARVSGGQVQDIAAFGYTNIPAFDVVRVTRNEVERDLNRAFLNESDVLPEQDRVTRLQIERIAAELEGALGGLYAPIAGEQQIPLIQRVDHLLEKKNLYVKLPDDAVHVKTLTGIAALSRRKKLTDVLDFAQIVNQLGPSALEYIDYAVLTNLVAQNAGLYAPGLIKDADRVAGERDAQLQQQLQLAGAEQTIQTAGNVIEKQTPPGAGF